VQARYDSYTQSAIDTQVFGAPTFMVEGEMFWGQDRLDFVAEKLKG
jgi:2-hydroxychromene-2-carboxylate isomerase